MISTPKTSRYRRLVLGAAAVLFTLSVTADDRSLFQATNAKPYVFFLIDISSSMHRTATGARTVASGEDPHARLYQAKSAAYQVITDPAVGDSIRYGWGTFNRERMTVRRKHWLYKLESDPPFYPGIPILPAGKPVIFGEPRHRQNSEVGDNGSDNDTSIDDVAKVYKHRRCGNETGTEDKILDFPKGGHLGDYTTVIYYENGSKNYRVTFLPLSGDVMGDPDIDVTVRIEELSGSGASDCENEEAGTAYTPIEGFENGEVTLNFVRFYVDDQADPDQAVVYPFNDFTDYISFGRSGNDTSPFSMDDYQVTSACQASNLANPADPDDGRSHRWDGNYDGDLAFGDQLTYDVTPDPLGRGRELARGDMIPWDWESNVFTRSNREEILLRLAPNLDPTIGLGETVPDFRVARYFQNVPVGGVLPLKPEFVDRPPIMNAAGTPIAGSLTSLLGWYDDWIGPAQDPVTGDPSFLCRQKFVILLTDGAESCESGSLSDPNSNRRRLPREAASALWDRGIRTFVVAFSERTSDLDSLIDIAEEGGTGAGVNCDSEGENCEEPGRDKDGDGEPDGPGVIFAENQQQLVKALRDVISLTQPQPISISAAAVPSVQADVDDKIFLTEFVPLDSGSVWPGSLQSFVKPLPVVEDETGAELPNPDRKCNGTSITTSCLAWDAQQVVVDSQVKGSESTPLGFDANQRRIFYSPFAGDTSGALEFSGEVPRSRRMFEHEGDPSPGTYSAETRDLWRGMGIPFVGGTPASETTAALRAGPVTDKMDDLKTATLPDGTEVEFVIGDFFHSDPLVVNAPSNTSFFIQDLEGDPAVTCEAGDAKSYRCFALRHQYRRKMLFIGSNAGMLHAFDAGSYQLPPAPELVDLGDFDNGTGREMFAYVPRPVMPTLVEMFDPELPERHKFTVDGPPVAADVFIDLEHAGTPVASQREWRTVLMGGLRRGGAEMGDRLGTFGELLDPYDAAAFQLASGYYMLDVTQPDLIQESLLTGRNDRDGDGEVDIWVPAEITNPLAPPKCLGEEDGTLNSRCGDVAFGSPRWEFLDVIVDGEISGGGTTTNNLPLRLDEDDNDFIDLAFTWSKPVIGRLRVELSSGAEEDRYVAIFGGGWDPLHPHERGNFIYMVDVETGKTLYKHAIEDTALVEGGPFTGGAIPASPAVVPTTDGYIDRIYFGTTLGRLYRLDMRPELADGTLMLPVVQENHLVREDFDSGGTRTEVEVVEPRILPETGNFFKPIEIFNVNEDVPYFPRSIFMKPSVFFIADLGQVGLAFGTGYREDLFAATPTPGPLVSPRLDRFVVLVDDIDGVDLRDNSFVPRTVGDLELVTSSSSFSGQNLLTDPAEGERGWYLELREEERLVGDPLVIAGVLFFSTFTPNLPTAIGSGPNILCEESGTSRIYGTLVSNAEGILADEDQAPARNIEVGGLVTAPFAEQSATKNPPDPDADPDAAVMNPEMRQLMEELKEQFPSNCTFPPGHRLDIKVRNQNTGLTFVVPIPICVVEASFKEF